MRVGVPCLQLVKQLVPAYVVHPGVETIEADVQGYHWTGCRVAEGRPQCVRDREAQVDVALFKRGVERAIKVSRHYEMPRQDDECPPRSYPPSLVHHLLMSVFSRASSYTQLRDLHLAQGMCVSGSWQCRDERVAVSGRPGDMLLSRHPLPPLFSAEEAESARPVAPPTRDLFSDLEQQKIRILTGGTRRERVVGGTEEKEEEGVMGEWTEGTAGEGGEEVTEGAREVGRGKERLSGSVFRHLHTLWIVDTTQLSEVQLLQRGLLFTFTRLLQQAVWQYGRGIVGQGTLPQPLSGQCVVTNGQRFTLLWLQVKDVRVGGEGGGEGGNVVAVDRLGMLYEGTVRFKGRRRWRVVGFNDNVLRTLLATLLMC